MTPPPQFVIEALDIDDFPEPLKATLRSRVERLGYLGDFFRYAGHQPDALLAFVAFGDAVRAALPFEVAEVVALTVAERTSNSYESNQHQRLSLANGRGTEWITAVLALDPATHSTLTEVERAVQRTALSFVDSHGHDAARELPSLVGLIGAAQTIAVLLLCGRCLAHAAFANALQLQPPVARVVEVAT